MKISLALGRRQQLSRQTAWGCLTTNLALPGFGSLVAGHASGYMQAGLGVAGLITTVAFGFRFILWYLENATRLQAAQTDPLEALADMWLAVRWALLGMGVFGLGWLWALATSLRILREAKEADAANEPPRLH